MTWELTPAGRPTRYAVPEDLVTIATGLGFPEGPIACGDGSVLVVEVRGEKLTRVLPDGRTETVAELPGGPNGAAVGPDGLVYVCNNGGLPWTDLPGGVSTPGDAATGSMQPASYTHGWIERVDVATGAVERLYDDAEGELLSAPNDIAFDADGTMWITDTGKTNVERTMLGAVLRAGVDQPPVRAAYGLMGPNGIALSPDGTTLIMADTPTGRLYRWPLPWTGTNARAHGGEVFATLPGATPLDSLGIDADGRVVVALPGSSAIAVVDTDGAMAIIEMPGPMPTNVCFGGPDGRTAFVTMGGRGELVAFQWPCAGATLPFNLA